MSSLLQTFPTPETLTETADQLGMLAGALTTVEIPAATLQHWGD